MTGVGGRWRVDGGGHPPTHRQCGNTSSQQGIPPFTSAGTDVCCDESRHFRLHWRNNTPVTLPRNCSTSSAANERPRLLGSETRNCSISSAANERPRLSGSETRKEACIMKTWASATGYSLLSDRLACPTSPTRHLPH